MPRDVILWGMSLVRVAGGVLWREVRGGGRRLAVVHRPDRDDWSLPKGRLDEGEGWRRAALREVVEETGCQAALDRFAGAKLFVDRDRPKLVLYWHMRLVRDGALEDEGEVDEVAWLSTREALSRLDHASDRRLVLLSLADAPGGNGRSRPPPLRERLLLDRRIPDDELEPYLRIVERAAGEQPRLAAGRLLRR
jgi:8-oxo-dGTP diphosphatase